MKIVVVLILPVVSFVPFAVLTPPRLGAAARAVTFPSSLHLGSSPRALVDGGRRAPSPFTERAIRERSKGWELKHLETPGWRLLMTDTFALRGDLLLEDLRAAGVYLEEFLKTHKAVLGGDTSDIRFSVHLFRDPREYRCYAKMRGVPTADSFYDPSTAEVVVYLDPERGREGLALALMHEFSHQYAHRVFERTGPIWFAEGLAEYFRHYAVVKGRVTPGADSDAHRARLREALDRGTLIPLRKLLAMDRERFYAGDVMLAYAEAWSFVRFLFDADRESVGGLLSGTVDPDLVDLEEAWMRTLKE